MSNLILRRFIQIALTWLFQAVVLFVSVGNITWKWAWVYLIAYAAMIVMNAIVLLPRHKDLIARRAQAKATAEGWDKIVGVAYGILSILVLVVAGLDARFGWTAPMALWRHIIGLVLMVGGFGVFTWAMLHNPFFSTVVTVATEDGHTVADTGPYRIMRHPGYAGSTLSLLATPILLGALWALIPMALAFAALVVRTALEDRTLHAKLPGYADYAARVKWRLIPGIW